MFYGYGVLNNHVPTLKATAMRGGSINLLSTSLYAVYKAESNANDSLGNYNGTAYGGITYATGKSGNAWSFHPTNGYIALPDNFKFSDSGSNAYSISLWCYMTDTTGLGHGLFTNFMQNAGIYYGWMVWYYQQILYFSRYNGNSSSNTLMSPTITMNAWYHIVVTRKNGSSKMYIDNVLVASDTTTTNTVYTTTHYPLIGARQSYITPNYDWFLETSTKVDEVNVWNKELTSTEVTELYNAGTGKFYPF